MTIALKTFASGDTDYIAKMNQNVSALTAAINALQSQAAAAVPGVPGAPGGPGSGVSLVTLTDALFNQADALIGVGSYLPVQGVSTFTISFGGMYLAGVKTVVSLLTPVTINLAGQVADTYYVVVDSSGNPSLKTTPDAGAAYAVVWSGTAFIGSPIRVAPAFYDTNEANASRISTALEDLESPPESPPELVVAFPTLDARLEATEGVAIQAGSDAQNALTLAYEALAGVPEVTAVYRKIGCTIDNTVGVKGAIQIDFAGTIVGWSIIADVTGSVSVEVDRKASSVPPAIPGVPNTTTDKISASAPIALSSAQSASSGTSGVSTWNTTLAKWDVIQFNVASITTITRATLYLQVLET